MGRIVWKALRRKRKGMATSSGKGQPDQPGLPQGPDCVVHQIRLIDVCSILLGRNPYCIELL